MVNLVRDGGKWRQGWEEMGIFGTHATTESVGLGSSKVIVFRKSTRYIEQTT